MKEQLESISNAKTEQEDKFTEIRGNYEKEVTNLKIQLKNASMKVSKSKFCSSTNVNTEKPSNKSQPANTFSSRVQHSSDSYEYRGKRNAAATENKPKLERQDSLAKSSWVDLKELIHSKDAVSKKKIESEKSDNSKASIASKKPSSSATSDLDDPLEHDLGSESSSSDHMKAMDTSIIRRKPLTNSARPKLIIPKSTQTLPQASGFGKATTPKIPRHAHESIDNYKDKYEQARLAIDTLKLDLENYKCRLEKKDTYTSDLKKKCVSMETELTLKVKEKDKIKEEIVEKERIFITNQLEIADLKERLANALKQRSGGSDSQEETRKLLETNSQLVDANSSLRKQISKLNERMDVSISNEEP